MAGNENKNTAPTPEQELAELRKQNADLRKDVATLQSGFAAQKKLIETLQDKQDEPEKKAVKPIVPEETFTVDKKSYKFTRAHFIFAGTKSMPDGLLPFAGKTVTALDALQIPDLLAELVKRKSSCIAEA